MSIKQFLVNCINNASDLWIFIRKYGMRRGVPAWREHNKWKVRHLSRGEEYPDQTFYIIRRYSPSVGVFSYMNSTLTNLRYCEEMGYVPVVDLSGNKSIYLTAENIGKRNVWELFFEQPVGVSPVDISHAKHVILGDGAYKYGTWVFDIFSESAIPEWRALAKKYIKPNARVMQVFTALWSWCFTAEDVVCGVLCRGPAYAVAKPANHPIQPTLDMVIAELREVQKTHGFTKIYLATEDRSAYDGLCAAFGDIVCSVADFTETNSDATAWVLPDSQEALEEKGVNYTASVLALAHADYLIGGNTSGTIAARLLSDGYKYEHIYDLGRYPVDDTKKE